MFSYLFKIIKRFRALRHVKVNDDLSSFMFARNVCIEANEGSEIILNNAVVRLGYSLPGVPLYAGTMASSIFLGKNSKLVFNGAVSIAPGFNIRVKDNATLTFNGHNHAAHNLLILCSRQVDIGEKTALSWNVTLIDDDEHYFSDMKGRKVRALYKPLIIGRNVGIQMNSCVPRGIKVGDNSVISCGTVARKDIPENCLAYQDAPMRIRQGLFSPIRSKLSD